jgi:SAM-dependent methyltransferase
MLNWLRRQTSGDIWPPIDYELVPYKHLMNGVVLNAGSGWRDVSHLVGGDLVNQDLPYPGEDRKNLHIVSPLHEIPRPDGFFDCILNIAVMEHVGNPHEVMHELCRVLKPGGHMILSVPFLQPEHKVPTDFQRYTRDGLMRLCTDAGLTVIESKPIFSVYHTLHWIVREWLLMSDSISFRALRVALLPLLRAAARRSTLTSDIVASCFMVIARKEAA